MILPCRPLVLVLAAAASLSFVGCATTERDNSDLERRLEQRNSGFDNRMERRGMRRDARDERYDRWFEAM